MININFKSSHAINNVLNASLNSDHVIKQNVRTESCSVQDKLMYDIQGHIHSVSAIIEGCTSSIKSISQ